MHLSNSYTVTPTNWPCPIEIHCLLWIIPKHSYSYYRQYPRQFQFAHLRPPISRSGDDCPGSWIAVLYHDNSPVFVFLLNSDMVPLILFSKSFFRHDYISVIFFSICLFKYLLCACKVHNIALWNENRTFVLLCMWLSCIDYALLCNDDTRRCFYGDMLCLWICWVTTSRDQRLTQNPAWMSA